MDDSLNDLREALDKIDLDLVAGLKQLALNIGAHFQWFKTDFPAVVSSVAGVVPTGGATPGDTPAPATPQPKAKEGEGGQPQLAVKDLLRLLLPEGFNLGPLLGSVAHTTAAAAVTGAADLPAASQVLNGVYRVAAESAGLTSPAAGASVKSFLPALLGASGAAGASGASGLATAAAAGGAGGAGGGALATMGGAASGGSLVAGGAATGALAVVAPQALIFTALAGTAAEAAKIPFDEIADGLNMTKDAVKSFGDGLTLLAKKDLVGFFTHTLDSAGQQLGKIPIVGGLLEAELGLLSQAIKTGQQVFNAFTKDLLDAQRHLANVSPSMGAVYAVYDMEQTLRDMQIGERTAGSAGNLADSYSSLQDHTVEFQVLLGNLTNGIGTLLTDLLDGLIVGPLNEMLGVVNDILKWLTDVFPSLRRYLGNQEGNGVPLGEWLGRMEDDDRRGRARGRPEFQRPNFGHLRP